MFYTDDSVRALATGRECPICDVPLDDSDNAVNEHYDTEHSDYSVDDHPIAGA